ncbi:DUF3427 domain-containing protein [Phocicoccus pinnipedialis]|uniref:DUF3427 domain-containing protein n=1 Tax=Phocicoccus pinnipedialis TaxID=110845 RepID=UPI001FD80899|nr:DEAD/DEAH box helicase [Jeotgalicoccus pinnipedialis]
MNSYERGFIDRSSNKLTAYPPELIVNNIDENLLSPILDEMDKCHDFMISVAFVTEGGLATLKAMLLKLKENGVRGRLITSTYLNFNAPKVFKELLKIENLDVRITDIEGFHAKGYVFKNSKYISMFIGSSNLTDTALKKNYEYNVKLTSLENGEVIQHFYQKFEELWETSKTLDDDWIRKYKEIYKENKGKDKLISIVEDPSRYQYHHVEEQIISPNIMQTNALQSLKELRATGENKGLIVSATGTGKTYLSAFDVIEFKPKKMLFLAHREQILRKTRDDYAGLIKGDLNNFGIYSGNDKKKDAQYIFATVQTLSQEHHLKQFNRDEFDYIVIDEAHRSAANTYKKLLNYFKPKFLLGMTATPERTDDADIFRLFDYNIAYEIRLQQALESGILTSFHYFGVTDFEVDEESKIDELSEESRIKNIVDKINYYGHSGETLRGLIFARNVAESYMLEEKLAGYGFRAKALSGDKSNEERESAVKDLENGFLDYLITVDIFNEGVDIPSVNQVVMLRQTQSAIIFIQQLGRGLRKHDEKEFLTVIDFIGNYKNNYLIPVALSGDNSYNKDHLRKEVLGKTIVTGASTVNFEEVAKERIFKSITSATVNSIRQLKSAFLNLKHKLGHEPNVLEFYNDLDTPDLALVFSKVKHYIEFLNKVGENKTNLPQRFSKMLHFISHEIIDGKRLGEVILLEHLMHGGISINQLRIKLNALGLPSTEADISALIRYLDLSFFTMQSKKKYEYPILVKNGNLLLPGNELKDALNNKKLKEHLEHLVQIGKENAKKYEQTEPLTLYKKYTRKDFCRLLNWETDESSTIYGYREKYNTLPIFITYHKDKTKVDTQLYEDELLDPHTLHWYTRPGNIKDKQISSLLRNHQIHDLPIYLFIKKDDDEGTDFYYLGQTMIDYSTVKETTMPQAGKEVVTMNMHLINPVEHELYSYLETI